MVTNSRKSRLETISRVIAGTLGAYGLTALATIVISLLLVRVGMDKVGAVTAATIASFAVFAAICMTVFHIQSQVRVWSWLVGTSLLLGFLWFFIARFGL